MQFTRIIPRLRYARQVNDFNFVRFISRMQEPLDSSKLEITQVNKPKEIIPNEQLVFGKSFTNHILEVEWSAEKGWSAPTITPYHNLSLDPSAVVFHYAFEAFEGLKAYRDADNKIRTFRPDRNMARLNRSAERISLPTFDKKEFLKLIDKFLALEKSFVPFGKGYSLYLRPTIIGTTAALGVKAPDKALLYVIASPVGPYYSTGFEPISLEATDHAIRAWPGGIGNCKLGANYAPCIKPASEAAKRGYQQNLWLFGEQGYITEVGNMNVFFVFRDSITGKKELVTAPLDGTILDGITRDSVLELAKDRLSTEEWIISERLFTINEVKQKAAKGELIEAFGSGTAAVVAPIKSIGWRDEEIEVPLANGNAGELTKDVAEWIRKIQYGEEEFRDWSRVVE